jgi:hypothetical protein
MFSSFASLDWSRTSILTIIDRFSAGQLNAIPHGFSNNLVWNAAHVMATQHNITYRISGIPSPVPEPIIAKYSSGTRPEGPVPEEGIIEIKMLLRSTAQKMREDYDNGLFSNFKPFVTRSGLPMNTIEEALGFNNFHEGMHIGMMMSLRKFL